MCSLSTRGFWHEIIGAMHELGRSGQITGTALQLARVGRCTAAEAEDAIIELKETKAADVSERNGIFTLINRRMKREFDERSATQKRVEKYRKSKSVTKCNANVTDEVTPKIEESNFPDLPVIIEENGNDTPLKHKSNGQGNANVTPYSSVSTSKNVFSDEKTKSKSGGGGSSQSVQEKPPPAAAEFSINNGQPETLQDYLLRKQLEFPQHDVNKVYADFKSKCGSPQYPKLKNTKRNFDNWLEKQDEELSGEIKVDGGDVVSKRAAINACNLCDSNGYLKVDGKVRVCRHEENGGHI